MSLNRFELDDVSDLKIIEELLLKLLMSVRISHEYGVLQLSYETTSYFILTQPVQGSLVLQREQR